MSVSVAGFAGEMFCTGSSDEDWTLLIWTGSGGDFEVDITTGGFDSTVAEEGLDSICLVGRFGFKVGLLVKTGSVDRSSPCLLEFDAMFDFTCCVGECAFTSGTEVSLDGFVSGFEIHSVKDFAKDGTALVHV